MSLLLVLLHCPPKLVLAGTLQGHNVVSGDWNETIITTQILIWKNKQTKQKIFFVLLILTNTTEIMLPNN